MWFNQLFNFPVPPSGGGNRRVMKQLARWENQEAYQDTFCQLVNMWLNLFKWEGLPETCNPRALEITLLCSGKALFFRDDAPLTGSYPFVGDATAHYWHTPVMLGEGINIYYEHINRRAYSYQYNKNFTIDNSVLLRNNPMMTPSLQYIILATRRLVTAIRQIEGLADKYKSPYIARIDETELKSWGEYEQQRQDNVSTVFVTKSFNPDAVTVIPTDAKPGTLKDLWDHYHNLENLVWTRMGINNANTDKKERLITPEVAANNGAIRASIDPLLVSRETAAEEINKMFGLNVSVKLKQEEVDRLGVLYNDAVGLSQKRENTV